jgi:hypothetical protein
LATGVTVVVADAVLFAAPGSNSAALTVAELVIEAAVAPVVVTTTATVALALELIVPRLQVNDPAAGALHVPALGVEETNVTPAGKVLVSITAVAGDGPAFDTVTV